MNTESRQPPALDAPTAWGQTQASRAVWLVEWRESPPFDGNEIRVFGNRAAAERDMGEMEFRGEKTLLYKVKLAAPVKVRVKRTGRVAT